MLKDFKEYLKEEIVRKRTPNLLRAENLIIESEDRLKFFNGIKEKLIIDESNAGFFIEQIYDILISLIRAKLFIDGFEASGNYSHEAEVSYLKELNFLDEEISLMDEIRQFRNGIKYYGKKYKKEDADNSIRFMNNILPKLKRILK